MATALSRMDTTDYTGERNAQAAREEYPDDTPGLVNLADLNARSVSDALLDEWTLHDEPAVRSIARLEISRRRGYIPAPVLSTDRALAREALRALDYQLTRLRAHLDEVHLEAEIGIDRKWCADTLIEITLTAHAYSQAFRAREA